MYVVAGCFRPRATLQVSTGNLVNLSYLLSILKIITTAIMKDKGTRAGHFPEDTRQKKTTCDDRVRIITLHDSAGMPWKEIKHHMGVDFRTCHAISYVCYGTVVRRKGYDWALNVFLLAIGALACARVR